MVPLAGIGPATSPLPRECSTTEPQGRHKKTGTDKHLERETGIEPASLAWKAKVLPLNYSRLRLGRDAEHPPISPSNGHVIRIQPHCCQFASNFWWRRLDSNQRRRKPTDLQSAPFSHSGTPPRRTQDYASFLLRGARREQKACLPVQAPCAVLFEISRRLPEMAAADKWLRRAPRRQWRRMIAGQDQAATIPGIHNGSPRLGVCAPEHENGRMTPSDDGVQNSPDQHIPALARMAGGPSFFHGQTSVQQQNTLFRPRFQ
jgi:hypothetical protein